MNLTTPNPSQQLAIEKTEGPLLIIAGPGAGKTKTLVERIVHLIIEKQIPAENIMVSTFTEKAAKELVTRVSNRALELNVPINLSEMYIGTLHSIFLRILEENREFTRLSRNYRMFDRFDQQYFIYNSLQEFEGVENSSLIMGDHQTSSWDKAQNIVRYISKISEESLDHDKLKTSVYPEIKTLGEIFEIYRMKLKEENALDFSEIQSEVFELLNSYTDVLQKIRERIKYIMVDEYQDTNTIQEKILFKMVDPEKNNICVVGDDDQGLYRFRGATIRNILEFQSNFKKGECGLVKLEVNYRSHPGIIDFYSEWMDSINWSKEGKRFRYDKTILPDERAFPDIQSVIRVSSEGDFEDWYNEIYEFITDLTEKGILKDFNQVAFLFKSVKGENVTGLADFLELRGVNVFSPRSALFFEREEVILALGVIVFIFPNLFEDLKWNSTAELKIWNFYQRCKDRFVDELRSDLSGNKELITWCQNKAKAHTPLKKNTDYGFTSLLYELLQFKVFSKFIDIDLNSSVHIQRGAYNLALLSKLFSKFEYLNNFSVFSKERFVPVLRKFFNQYLRFLYDGGIEEYEDFDHYAPEGCVSIMTIHQSKGLEFPVVMVGSLNLVPRKDFGEIDLILQENYFHKPPYEPIEETKNFDFWRLFYTAFSRAQNLLVLTGRESNGRGLAKLPSKYFEKHFRKLGSWRDEAFTPENLDLEPMKEINIKHEYSFTSDILVYENCPLQYKFFRELEFSPVRTAATLFGILVHESIEDIHKAVLRGEAEMISPESITSWYNRNYNTLSKTLKTYLGEGQKAAALEQVINYYERQKNDWDKIKEAEVDVSLVKDAYILRGKIDLVRGEGDSVEIIDFKSEWRKPNVNDMEEREKLDRYKRQLEVYAHIVEERTGYNVSRMHLYYTGEKSGTPYITYDYSKRSIDKTIKTFDLVVDLIESKNYDMKKVKKCEKLCGNCDFRYYCNFK